MVTTSTTISTTALEEALQQLARGQKEDLAGLLTDVEVHAKIENTRIVFHLHCLRLDGNGRPRVRDLVRAICENVLDFAIPRSEINAAKAKLEATGSSAGFARLTVEARRLFTDLAQTGEGGELLLFVLAEQILGLPQLICKMSLKTNTRMHVHGADGLHAGVDPGTNKLLLYWGESKIYEGASDAIRECLASLAPMLKTNSNGSDPADRDLQLLQRFADIDDPALERALKQFLDPRTEASTRVEFRGLGLVGFDCEHYPKHPGELDLPAVVGAMKTLLPGLKKQVGKRVVEEMLDPFGMHFFCVPFPSTQEFTQRLRIELGITHGATDVAS
ncbi:MAG: DUF1837 domain-containing protein [Ignavibacteriota bacterium]